MALLRDFVLCRFEWIRKDLSSAQGSHLYRFRDASCSARPTAASSRPLRCHHRFASVCSCPAKPTTALSRPLRCMRRSVSECFRAAKPISEPSRPLRCVNLPVSQCPQAATPTIAVLRPLRCIRRPISACFRAARRIPASFCPLRRPRASSALFSLVRSDCWAEAQSPFSIAKPLQGFPERLRY